MNMVDIIQKKRDGKKLSREEIYYFVKNYTAGHIPDYQASALLMAVYFSKMDKEETFHLTDAVKESGDMIDLSLVEGIKVDKHSTGGVGDKTTLIAAPIAAACGVPIAKMSGRGLGFTGGTIDKLESIPGFQTELAPEEFVDRVNRNGIAIIGQSAQIAKADKLLYALRDVTATMENSSLIAASVMSKKLAAGSDAILLDVKCGSGAFMNHLKDAEHLSRLMVEIGNRAQKRTVAVITDMSQPLGQAIGNSLEVMESIEVLKNEGPKDITELSVFLAGIMLYLGEKAKTPAEGRECAQKALQEGRALDALRRLIKGQGGDENVIEDPSLFPQAAHQLKVISNKNGYVNIIKADILGRASQKTGAGRIVKGDKLDFSAGVLLHKKLADSVKKGECLAVLYGNDRLKLENAFIDCQDAFQIGETVPRQTAIVKKIIGISPDE